MAQGFSLKDQLFNADKVRYLAGLFATASPAFDGDLFEQQVMERLPGLELKQRISWIAECLGARLPGGLDDIAPVLRDALPPPLDPTLTDDDFGDFIFAPLGELVVLRGLDSPDPSLDLIEEITQRFSMEWAIRPFLNRWPDRVLDRMRRWATHPSYHVRRLVSEGSRPRLPWGQAVDIDITAPLPLLDLLHRDQTRYVTRSVANHLNDISKKHPALVVDRLEQWAAEATQQPGELDWMTQHALRGLVKAGDARALSLLGYDADADVEVLRFDAPGSVAIGDALTLTATLCSGSGARALVDYVFWRRRANGDMAPKVFKLKQLELSPGKPVDLRKSHKLKGDATTFRLYPGPHRVELQINGRVRAEAAFDLIAE